MSPQRYNNHVLKSLNAKDWARLEPHLEASPLTVRQSIENVEQPIAYVYFPLSGIVSIVAHEGEYEIEVGIVGRDGMTGTSVVLGSDTAALECFVQVAGHAVRIRAAELKRALNESPTLAKSLLAYVRDLLLQTAQTAVANGRCTVEERLARWLLMTQDRIDDEEMPMTHEFLAIMLGVRRPGITVALNALEKDGAIRNVRGLVTILDRGALEDLAGGAYRPLNGAASA
jgi:CRP-like cAMP-binding protein